MKITDQRYFLTHWKCSLSQKVYMEYVPQTLKTELRSRSLLVHEKISIIKQIALSVAHLHQIGIVHRDIKT